MKGLINAALSNKVAANLLMVFILIAGFASLPAINIRLFPAIDIGKIAITVPYPGATPSDVETAIVRPIEERLEGLEGVEKVTGLAASGVGNVVVDIVVGENMQSMLDDIKSEVDRITVFPLEAEEPQITIVETDELASQIVVYGPVSTDLLKQAADRVRADLADSDAISLVEIAGVPDYLIDITISEDVLRARGLSLTGVAGAIAAQSIDLSGGEIEDDTQRRLIRSVGERRTGAEFESIVVGTGETGTPIRLGDVARINDGLADDPVLTNYKGQNAAVVNIYRVGAEKQLDVAAAVKAYVDSELALVLPEGISADLWRDESIYLRQRIEMLSRNAILGLLLVVALLLAFLDLRIAFWTAAGVAVSFIGAFFLMYLFGVTINQLSLFGFILAIGIIVDDAIVVGENIHANWRKGLSPMEAARVGVGRVATPVLFSVSTTITAFVPLILIPGVFGQFLGQVAAVVILLLILSLVESFFILPRHLSHLKNDAPAWWSPRRLADPFRDWVSARLRAFRDGPLTRMMRFVVFRPGMIAMIGAGIFFATLSLLASGTVKFIFFPSVEGEYVTAQLELAEGSSEQQSIRHVERLTRSAEQAAASLGDPDTVLQGVLWSIGAPVSESGSFNDGAASGASGNKVFIVAKIEDSATRRFTASQFESAWRTASGEIPGAQQLTFTSDLVSPDAPIQLQISTRNPADTRAAVKAMRDELAAIGGVYEVRDDRFRTTDEVQIRLKPLASDYGLTQTDLAREVRAAFFGAEAVRIQRDREEIPVRVRLPADQRDSLETLKELRIRVGNGYIPMSSLAELSIAPAPAAINRVNGRRIYALTAFVDESITTADAVTATMLDVVAPRLAGEFDGLEVGLAGDQEEQAQAGPAIARNFLMALMVIFILLALNFGSYSQPIVIMLAIPFGFVGALIGHAMLGLNLTLLSMFGVIGLSGVIINTSLMVTDFLNERLAAGERHEEAVMNSMLDRFRAILLTTLTTFLGVTPIIFETSVQAQFLIPTAVSLGFGILIGTTILLFVLPALLMLHLRVFGASHAVDADSQHLQPSDERKGVATD